MTPRPWAEPELVARGRLPMHAVPARGPPVARRDVAVPAPPVARGRSPATTGARSEVPGALDDAGHVGPAALHERADAVPGPPARGARRSNPTGVYERTFRLPDGWLGRRVVLHVGAAESVLIVELDGAEVGVSKDSHLAAEFDLTDVVRAGRRPRPAADGRQVVRRVVRRGPGPVVARRDHAAGVPVRDRSDVPRGRGRSTPASTRTARPGRSGSAVHVGLAAGRARTGLAGRGDRRGAATGPPPGVVPHQPPPAGRPGDWVVPGPPRRGILDLQSLAARGPCRMRRTGSAGEQAEPVVRPGAHRRRAARGARPGRDARGRPRCRRCTALTVALIAPGRVGRRADRAADRVPAGGGDGRPSCWSTASPS